MTGKLTTSSSELGYDYAFVRRDVDYTHYTMGTANGSPAASLHHPEKKTNGASAHAALVSNEREQTAPGMHV